MLISNYRCFICCVAAFLGSAVIDLVAAESNIAYIPGAVGAELGDDSLRFFFISMSRTQEILYYQKGKDYHRIEPAYNSFGFIHKVSKRPHFVLYEKITKVVNGANQESYVPRYTVNVAAKKALFAIFLPLNSPTRSHPTPLSHIDFTTKHFPYNHVTFVNALTMPLMLVLGDEKAVVAPNDRWQTSYTTSAKGAGYLRVALAIREAEGNAQLLYHKKIGVFKDERILAIPILDPYSRAQKIEVLTYRDAGQSSR